MRPLRFIAAAPPVVREVAEVALLALVLYVGIHLVVEPVRVEGTSMVETLHDQDYLVARTVDYRFHPPQRGDIVVVRGATPGSRNLIKRVIALPGERLLIRSGRVLIDGRTLSEPYLPEPWTVNADWPAPGEGPAGGVVMPPHQFFVMGDNRNDSLDSRSFGPVDQSRLEARAWLRILPLNAIGPVDERGPALQ